MDAESPCSMSMRAQNMGAGRRSVQRWMNLWRLSWHWEVLEGGREGGRGEGGEGGGEGGRERGRKGGREGGREEGREEGKERGRERNRKKRDGVFCQLFLTGLGGIITFSFSPDSRLETSRHWLSTR